MPKLRTPLPALLAASMSLCLTAQPGQPPAKPGAAVPPAPADPSALKPFADIIKDARESKGFFATFQKEDKVWIEVAENQLDKPFLLTWNMAKGIGEAGLYGGMMGGSQMVAFRRIGNTLQLLALNSDYQAQGDKALQRAITESFSESLLGSAPVLCKPHPERKSVLVDASALLFTDLPQHSLRLEQIYRQNYGLDKGNTSFAKVRTTPDLTAFTVNGHYMAPRIAVPNAMTPPAMRPTTPDTVPDARSLFLGTIYNFLKLPETPMTPRLADDRVGYFVTTQWDFAKDRRPDMRQRLIHRWRLEKKDPAAALSEPKEPIVYWVDRSIPEKFRQTVVDAILEWNHAFESAGFKNAVQVKIQPEDADWDTLDAKHASIRWLVGTDVAFAIGPSIVDPRTGEILDADIGLGEGIARMAVEQYKEEIPRAFSHLQSGGAGVVSMAELQQIPFAMDLLGARGDLDMSTPEGEAFQREWLKWIVTHEVGHTMGLRHNFKASTIYTEAQLQDPEFTKAHGMAGSIMEYTPINIPLKGEKHGQWTSNTLGPYDHWAIEFGYKAVEPAKEAEELARIADRSAEPWLAYSTDEDAMFGLDPDVNTFDLGPDTLAYAKKRILLSAELCERIQERAFQPGEPYHVLRRQLGRALGQIAQATSVAAKYLGGVHYNRDHAGTGRPNLAPVPAEKQREALRLMEKQIFSLDAFRFKPEFLARMTNDRTDLADAFRSSPDFSLSQRVLGIQKLALAQLMNPAAAQRILDAGEKLSDSRKAFRLSELYDALQGAIWSEARTGKEPSLVRRSLQREHLRAMGNLVLKAAPGTPEDARSLARESLNALGRLLRTAALKPGLSKETKAHYAECQSQLQEVLKAGLQRTSL